MIKIHDQGVPARGCSQNLWPGVLSGRRGQECDQEGVDRNEPRCDMVTPRG